MKNIIIIFSLSLFGTCLCSCLGPDDTDRQLGIAQVQTEKYYKFFKANQDDSILTLLSAGFYAKTDTAMILKHLEDLHKDFGEILSNECVYTKQSNQNNNGKHEAEIILTYKVKYKSKFIIEETFDYRFNKQDSNKIFSMNFVEYKKDK